jgi:hypothetical protein
VTTLVTPVPAVVLLDRCHYCSKHRLPGDIHTIGGTQGGAKICRHCLEWHHRALRMFCTGKPPEGCQECGITFDQLTELAGGGDIPMYIHVKDGIYQILCRACSDKYERKRLDLYGDTAYGLKKKLKGAK